MGNVFEFPLKQHIGNKAAACVVKGDVIHRGQLLALQGDGLGCNIFSSVSGKVLEITDESVSVEADEKQTTDYIPLKSEEPLDLIKEAGLVGRDILKRGYYDKGEDKSIYLHSCLNSNADRWLFIRGTEDQNERLLCLQ